MMSRMKGAMEGNDRRNQDEEYFNEILIETDGTVVIKHLTEPLLRLAETLNPKDEDIIRRVRRLLRRS